MNIPDMERQDVIFWANKIKPLIREGDTIHHILTEADYFDQSYPWSCEKVAEAKSLIEVARIRTLHRYGYYGFFKPSAAEVIQQIPKDMLPEVSHYLVNGPDTADDLNREREALDAGFHVAETILYKEG